MLPNARRPAVSRETAGRRAATSVVEAVLAGRLPTTWEFELMADTALRIYPALEAIESRQH